MELLRSGFSSVLGGGGGGGADEDASSGRSSAADTIERLVDRLRHSTLLEDRRDACRALKAMSRKFRVEVGVQALDAMTQLLEMESASHDGGGGGGGSGDEESLAYALDTLCNVCSPDEFEEEVGQEEAKDNISGVGEQFTEILMKEPRRVQVVVDLLEDVDFRVRRPTVKLLTHLLLNKPREMQELILSSQRGVSRLMDILADTREVLRNDALLLLIQLTKGNANLQKIVAFENCFDKLVDLLQVEGYSDGGIVVEDALRLMLNLLRNNASNQTFFREGSYIQRVAPFFELTLDEEEIEVGWSAQKVSNMLHMLLVIRTLVSPSNPTLVTASCQSTILSCGLLEKLCSILMAAGIPADILTESINAISESIRGSLASQEFFARVEAPSVPPKPALILLLMSMVNERQPFALKCAVLYCFQCFLHQNPAGQSAAMRTLLPGGSTKTNGEAVEPSFPGVVAGDVTAGQLLCGGLFSADKLSNWFSCVALAHGLADQESIKLELLRVQLSTAAGNTPTPLLVQCCTILQQTSNNQTRLGLLMLLSMWIPQCPTAVAQLLQIDAIVPFLTGQIGSNEHDEVERLSQGLCAFVLGLCVVYNDNNQNHSQEQLFQLIEKRIGFEVFMDKLSEVSKHESYNKALKHPQLKCLEAKDLIFDHKFCKHFKQLEHVVINHLTKRKENSPDDDGSASDPAVVLQYKELIREQDGRISELSHANIYLQQELATARQHVEELSGQVQTLQDQNSLLRAQATSQSSQPQPSTNGVASDSAVQSKPDDTQPSSAKLQVEIQIRDDIIHELEMRLASAKVDEDTPKTNGMAGDRPSSSASCSTGGGGGSGNGTADIELRMLHDQLQALQATLGQRETEMGKAQAGHANEKEAWVAQLAAVRKELETTRAEQDDLLMLMADQEESLAKYQGMANSGAEATT